MDPTNADNLGYTDTLVFKENYFKKIPFPEALDETFSMALQANLYNTDMKGTDVSVL